MKRKLFSAILFGALLTASTSGLTSCKDYDDDISNLQGQIDKLATADQLSAKVSEMQTAIAAAQTAAEGKAAAAQTVADAAKTAAKDATTTAEAAATAANAASQAVKDLEAKGATKAELEAAAKAAEEAVKAIEAAHATDKAAIEAAIDESNKTLQAEIKANAEKLTALDKRLKAVEDKLAALEAGEGEVSLESLQLEIEAIGDELDEIIGAYSTMITSINIFKISNGNTESTSSTWNGSATVYAAERYNELTGEWEWDRYSWPYVTYYFWEQHSHQVTSDFVQNYDGKLNFYQVVERGNEFPKAGETAEKFVFEEGYVRTYEDSILVRVNPVGAVLKKENISLINSQGKELNGLIEVTDVRKFDGLLTGSDYRTRSTEVENGLWVIKVKPVDNYSAEDFANAAISGNSSVLYAVSVKNDEKNVNVDADRRVISEYGLSLWNEEIDYWDNFSVSDYSDNANNQGFKQIYNIHNRYLYCETETRTSTTDIPELEWTGAPDVTITDDNTVNRPDINNDNRQNKTLVIAKVGDKIKIHNDGNIKGFYVTLDYKYARESGKSELNAWNSYSYENVTKISRTGEIIEKGKLQEGPDGYITVKDMNDVEGDIIGFRLYAVNLDGTIVNPDGRAFYVGLGTFNNDVTLDAQTIAITTENYTNFFDVNAGVETGNGISSDYIDVTKAFDVEYDWIADWKITSDKEGYTPGLGSDYDILYWEKDNDGNYIGATQTEAEYITVKLIRPEMFEDNLDYTLTLNLKPRMTNTSYTTRTVTVDVKKTMPTFVPTFSYITEQTKNQIMVPHDAYHNVDYKIDLLQSKEGYKDLNNVYLFDDNSVRFKNDRYFSYDIATSAWNADNEKDVLNVTTPYQMHIGGEFVDNKEEHSVKSTYLYQNISRIWDAKNNRYVFGQENDHQYRVEKATNTPLVYMSWAYYNKYSWAKKNEVTGLTDDYAPTVKWIPAGNATLDLDLSKLIVKNTADGATFNKKTLDAYLTANWLKIKDGSVRTYVGVQDNPYFKPTSVTNTTIKLEQKEQVQAAPANTKHTEKVEFVVYDCFLNEYTVTLDFTVTRD